MKWLVFILPIFICTQLLAQVDSTRLCLDSVATTANIDTSARPYKIGGIISGKLVLTEEQLKQLDSLVKDFDLWYADRMKPKKKWHKLDASDLGMIAVGAIGGGCRGLNQAILFRGYGKGNEFWDIDLSWKRKYKDYDGGDKSAAFPGSKTVLVGLTDGYHGTRLGETMCYAGGAFIIGFDMLKKYDKPGLAIAKKILLFMIANGLAFQVFYK